LPHEETVPTPPEIRALPVEVAAKDANVVAPVA
jgi:hypothetical protein